MRTKPALFAKASTFGGGGISQSEMTEGVHPGSTSFYNTTVAPAPILKNAHRKQLQGGGDTAKN